ncbi:PilW family protein [Synoicihabitans lomoniglobus]|uniref:Prepilin-type N-terminal cleavage/methylation domain-containing protein n=1 Tax=Synoicihabitans lomoniglobus TaxID=2909285 RepID=A0AAF0CP20_9BACT|nr:prepilin-type N-terminal cleavage/methylation domain-containing protein [Opitutaceae bacterium LMO-M01]WED65451.1 prepilin-type N-terminal cleavage/methylation domain-containing protein [Opitutaceae bacterium LMO-M01]
MITITRSPDRNRQRGISLVEVMVGATIAAFVMTGVMTTFLFLGRSGANISNYAEMESEARVGLEYFAQDTRQASELTWNSANSVTLTVNGVAITYAHDAAAKTFTRQAGAGATTTMIDGILTFKFDGYMITGAQVDVSDLSTIAKRDAASDVTKQLQVYLKASRVTTTVSAATNTVLSARYILRNKRVSA